MQIEGRVGPQALSVGAQQPPRLGNAAEMITDDAHGRFYEAVYRQGVFSVSNAVAGVAPGTALSTTPPIILYNPTGNTKNLVILRSSLGYISGTLGGGTIVYASGAQATAPTGGTVLTPKNSLIGNGAAPTSLCYTGSTLTAAPTIVRPAFILGAWVGTTATLQAPLIEDLASEFILTPGNVFCMQGIATAGTTPLVLFGLTWEETPI